jgi:hypothetical protein
MTYGSQSQATQRQVVDQQRPPQKGVARMAIYQRGKSYYYDFVHKGQRYAGCMVRCRGPWRRKKRPGRKPR